MTRVALLDVNVLIALFDPDHVHHEPAHRWFGTHRRGGWATCPMTENAVVRILSNVAYSGAPERPAQIVARLHTVCGSGNHVFWPDDVSVRDATLFDPRWPVGHRQLADVYLLGLAKKYGGRLASFDRGIPVRAIRGADSEHLAIIPV